MNKPIAIILARVSTTEQEEGHSIDAQIKRLQDYALRKDFKIIKTFKIIESSTRGHRKEFQAMIEFIKAQKGMIVLIADAVDRVQRSFKESVLLDDLRKAEKVSMHFLREGIVLDKDATSRDIMMWDFAVMGAKSYVLSLSDNVKRSVDYKIQKGEWPGKAPIGYKNVDLDNGQKDIIPDPDRAFLIKKAFELYATDNYSLSPIVKILKEHGLTNNTPLHKPVGKSQLDWILKNPFYYGEMRIKGTIRPHKYRPIIDRWLFEKCQEVRERRTKKNFKYNSKSFIFKGLIRCAYCGCAISSDRKKNKYTYLSCNQYKGKCGSIRIREEIALEQIKNVLNHLVIPDEVLADVKIQMENSHKAEREFYQSSIDKLRRESDLIDEKVDTMYQDRLVGRITTEYYDDKVKESKAKQEKLNDLIQNHSQADEDFLLANSYVLDLSTKAYDLFSAQSSQVEQKRQLLNFLLSNLKLEGKKLHFSLKSPFDAVYQCSKTKNWLRDLDS
jgi:DNA invertase Pin-like site-specific DNA recombinase